MACIPQHQAEDFANAGHGWPQGERRGVRGLGRGEARACQVRAQCSVRGEERQVDREGLRHGRRVQALGDTGTVGLGSDVLAALGQGILAVGLLDMRQEGSALAPQGRAAT
jgi:hypothetical protein